MATKEEWNLILDSEDSQLFILSLIDDICERANKVLFDKQIDVQILPWAVKGTKQTLLDLIHVKYTIDFNL
jgi:hypothetical protein